MSVHPRQKFPEVTGIALTASALALAAMLLTFNAYDASLNVATPAAQSSNFFGRTGSVVADFLLQWLGLAAFLLPVPLLVIGYRLMRRRPLEAPLIKFFGFLVLVLSLCSTLALVEDRLPESLEFAAGGVTGILLGAQLLTHLNLPGSLLLLVTLIIVSLLMTTRFSVASALDWAGERLSPSFSRFKEELRERWDRHDRRRQLERINGDKRSVVTQKAPRKVTFEAPESAPLERMQAKEFPFPSIGKGPAVLEEFRPGSEDESTFEPQPLAETDHPLPLLEFLQEGERPGAIDEDELRERARLLEARCAEFDVRGQVVQIHPGPVVTTFEFRPDPGIKYSRITNLSDDLCLALKAESVRIDRLPGKNTVGIEVPNLRRQTIYLREILSSESFQKADSLLTLGLGKRINGDTFVADLARMPHLLIAGATGAGKSVGLNCLVCSILYKARPHQVRFIMIDPKRLELGLYEGIPHLFAPIVTDPKKAANALSWAVREMEKRYRLLARYGVRSIDQFNELLEEEPERFEAEEEEIQALPYLIIIVDELADLMITTGKEVEASLTRLAQMARAIGIHLILATQRPSVDVLTGLIKANFPSRLSFRVSSKIDSRTILDANGAEQLLGRGDLLFLTPESSRLIRIHGPLISEKEIAKITSFLKKQAQPEYHEEILADAEEKDSALVDVENLSDELYHEAARFVVETGRASTSLLQRRLRIGYGRAARLLDIMEHEGLIGPADGSKAREVLVPRNYFDEIENN